MALGTHILAELYECSSTHLLCDVNFIEKQMLNAANVANATIVTTSFHHFSPLGVSGVIVIAESHLAIHTWPEYGYCAVDIFTCGETLKPKIALDYLVNALFSKRYEYNEIKRGISGKISKTDAVYTPSFS